jgi:hypothetical protein
MPDVEEDGLTHSHTSFEGRSCGQVNGSSRHNSLFATGGMILAAIVFGLLMLLPIDFIYWQFAFILLLMGIGLGLYYNPTMLQS